jgi:phosphate/sulfate permease
MKTKTQLLTASGLLLFGIVEVLEGAGVWNERATFRGFPMHPFQSYIVGVVCMLAALSIFLSCWRGRKEKSVKETRTHFTGDKE